jgi:hypothetical protein
MPISIQYSYTSWLGILSLTPFIVSLLVAYRTILLMIKKEKIVKINKFDYSLWTFLLAFNSLQLIFDENVPKIFNLGIIVGISLIMWGIFEEIEENK